MSDEMAVLVQRWVRRGEQGLALRREVGRHVASVARPYPDAWFELGEKSPDAIDALADRVFTVCSSVPKGRYPFSSREPFRACVEERFDGRDIRYHCFYARLSVTRELLRDDYARNVSRDPVLRWRAELFASVGEALPRVAVPVDGKVSRIAAWRLKATGPTLVRRADEVVDALRRSGTTEVEALVARALRLGGPSTQSRLTNLLAEVLTPPSDVELDAPPPEDPAQRLAVRAAIAEVWSELSPEERDLLRAIARGDSYDELIAANPRFKHRVAVTRAVERVNRAFVSRLAAAFGLEASPTSPPKETLDLILDILSELISEEIRPVVGGAA